ncbi:hypothetical protein ACFW2Y_26955, partial [Streptomyces sp. NPDC058877]|uniref:hypothetical protein n=1 Tax=Streptomyces sp. NPDC058877 TaxID=3346665 RepID=UPI00368D2BA0
MDAPPPEGRANTLSGDKPIRRTVVAESTGVSSFHEDTGHTSRSARAGFAVGPSPLPVVEPTAAHPRPVARPVAAGGVPGRA